VQHLLRRAARSRLGVPALATTLVVALAPLVADAVPAASQRERTVVADAAFPVALTPDGVGGLLYAERRTGLIRHVDATGRLAADPVGRVSVSTGGQRGLLGIATGPGGQIFAAFTEATPGRAIVVEEVAPEARRIWSGPPSASLANGGHLLYDAARGRLVVGIGDLGRRVRVADPDAPNGKLLLLDPAAEPTQRPSVLSSGWNNPFAFTLTESGRLWVADNVPGDRGERLARGDVDGRPTHVTRMPTGTVPAAIASPRRDLLIVCSFARGRSLAYRIVRGRARRSDGFGDDARCRTGVARQEPTRGLWLADEHSIRVLAAPATTTG
jgi:hypothetical protein